MPYREFESLERYRFSPHQPNLRYLIQSLRMKATHLLEETHAYMLLKRMPAKVHGGVTCFFRPRTVPDGSFNNFFVRA